MKFVYLQYFCRTFFFVVALVLSGCGGGGGNASAPTTTTNATSTGSVPGVVDVLTTATTINSGGAAITVTVVVKDAGNVAIANTPVTLSASSGSLLAASSLTNSSGVVTATLDAGNDKSLRTITISATAGAVTKTAQVSVVGTKLTVTGPTTVQLGSGLSSFSARAVDSSVAGIAGAQITVSSSLGNTLGSVTTTDASGNTSFTYNPINSGIDTLTINGLGFTTSYVVTVSGADFKFTSPTNNATVNIGASQAVTVRYFNGGVAVSGATVSFATTRGNLSASSAVTNGSGLATVNVSSTSAGAATVTASLTGGGASATLPLSFVSTTPTSITVQASPSAMAPNLSGSTANRSTISVTLMDADLNPVATKQVDFTIIADNAGSLSAASALTDSSGVASVQYIPGSGSTAINGVRIRATVHGAALSNDVYLTVNNAALFINIAFASKLGEYSVGGIPVGYDQVVAVYVTDSNGAAVANQNVTLSLTPVNYEKGQLIVTSPANSSKYWDLSSGSAAICANEDVNGNGILDAADNDLNSNGTLEPGNVGALLASNVTTDAQGWASTSFRYAKKYALWTQLKFTARAVVAGTESTRSESVWLPITVTDNNSTDGPGMPWSSSPFGTAGLCSNPN